MKSFSLVRILLLVIAIQLPCFATSHSSEDKLKLIIFGDSLVDIGNDLSASYFQTTPDGLLVPGLVIPPATRYDRGNFSNGPVVSNFLAHKLKVAIKPSTQGFDFNTDSVSYGYGGSENGIQNLTPGLMLVPGLLGQVQQYIAGVEENNASLDNTVFFMWTGANDYFNNLALGIEPDPFLAAKNILEAAAAITDNGGELVVVGNLPDLGQTPFCNIFGICDLLSQLTYVHNDLLAQGVESLNSTTEAKVVLFDAFTIFNKILAAPADYDLPNNVGTGPASGCLFQPPATFLLENCTAVPFKSTSVFWDEMHPATETHKIFANEVWKKCIKKNLRD